MLSVVVLGTGPSAPVDHALRDALSMRVPDVEILDVDGEMTSARALNAGLSVARGRYVSFVGSDVELVPDALIRRIEAHRMGWPMVTGAATNGDHTAVGWASYLLDHARFLPGRSAGALDRFPESCSYNREVLLEIGGFPTDDPAGGQELVNRELFARGYGAWFTPEVTSVVRGRYRAPAELIAHEYSRGRSRGRLVVHEVDADRLSVMSVLAAAFVETVAARVARIASRVRRWNPELRWKLVRASPLILAAATSEWLGMCREVWRARARQERP
jgi:hypothetical protein